jgi:hypothetical protein
MVTSYFSSRKVRAKKKSGERRSIKDHSQNEAIFFLFPPSPNYEKPSSPLQEFYRPEDVVEDVDFGLPYWQGLKS